MGTPLELNEEIDAAAAIQAALENVPEHRRASVVAMAMVFLLSLDDKRPTPDGE